MKKSIALVALAFGVTNAFAQDLTSKKGEPILPEAGDWGIGVDATPFLQYAGNFFGKATTNTAPTFNFFAGQTITGRYFQDAQTVYRGSLRIGFGSESQRQMVDDRSVIPATSSFPTADPMVENVYKQSNTNIGLAAGIEKRRGKTRLQGYYGGEVGINLSTSKDKFTYGNALNPTPTGTNPAVGVTTDDAFSGASNIGPVPSAGSTGSGRITERKNGTSFSFGVRGFIGAEYFVLPKMSIGGEFGWGIGLTSIGKSKTTWESTGNPGTGPTVGSTTVDGAKQSEFRIDTDNRNSVWGPSGSLRLNFYF